MNGSKYLTRSTSVWSVKNNTIMGMRYVLGVVSVKRYYDVLLMILCVCFFFMFQQIR